MFFDSDNTDWEQVIANSNISQLRNIGAIDFDADNPPHFWMIGLSAFDTSILHSPSTAWDDTSLTGADTADVTINNYPGGSYRAFVGLTGSVAADEDATFVTTGAQANGSITITNIPNALTYYFIDFIAADPDNITFTVTRTGGTGAITMGDLIVIPCANSKNMPLDYRDQMLANISLDESLSDQ
jgi:hypothetical protein